MATTRLKPEQQTTTMLSRPMSNTYIPRTAYRVYVLQIHETADIHWALSVRTKRNQDHLSSFDAEQDRQCTCERNIEARSRKHCCRGKAIIIKNYVCVCLYSCLSYSACKLHLFCAVLCCHLWPVWLYHIVTHYLIKTRFSDKSYGV